MTQRNKFIHYFAAIMHKNIYQPQMENFIRDFTCMRSPFSKTRIKPESNPTTTRNPVLATFQTRNPGLAKNSGFGIPIFKIRRQKHVVHLIYGCRW